jgi:hypothetical protein
MFAIRHEDALGQSSPLELTDTHVELVSEPTEIHPAHCEAEQ